MSFLCPIACLSHARVRADEADDKLSELVRLIDTGPDATDAGDRGKR